MTLSDESASPPGAAILRQEEIRRLLRDRMTPGAWIPLENIYDLVEANAVLSPADREPAADGSSDPRWRRNVRNLLQRWKESDELDWDGDAHYRLAAGSGVRGADVLSPSADWPAARQLLEGLRGREIRTVTGVVNRILSVGDRTALVATSRSPAGQPVPIEWVQEGMDKLARDGEVDVTTNALEHRSAFIAAVLLTLPDTSAASGPPTRIVLGGAAKAVEWHLAPGDTIRRVDLHARFGGSRQGGMTSSRSSPNILLFLDRDVGNPHGYFDGWVGDRFYYTGHGQHGDQTFRAGNAAVLRHREDGRALRLFRGAGGTIRYLGEFALDGEQPYFQMEAPESETGLPRQVIVFRLTAVGPVIHDADDELVLPDGVTAPILDAIVSSNTSEPQITRIPVEQQNVEEVQVARTSESYTALRREQKLVLEYTRYLESRGSTVVRFRAQAPGEARPIVCDVYDETRNNLVEGKGTGARGELRMAIGQLTDYARFVATQPARAVLVPARPRPDLEALLRAAHVAAVWPAYDGGFEDNAGGRFV
jgi:hypothetical protein